MKIVFFGSDEFAATNLERLIQDHHEIVGVVTPPDRARDRLKVTFLPVKMVALEREIPVFQPDDLNEQPFQAQLKNLEADIFVVVAYGKFLPNKILILPKLFCINVHASLLPQYRGAAPVNYALMNGDQRTGVTVIKINEQMDAGDIIAQRDCGINDAVDAQTLCEQLAELGAECLGETIALLESGHYALTPQDEQAATFAPKLTKDMGRIDWQASVDQIHNLVRGLVPWPGAYTFFKDKSLKILETAIISHDYCHEKPGTVIQLVPEGIVVACQQGKILLKQVHLESCKPMDGRSFSVGRGMNVGYIFP